MLLATVDVAVTGISRHDRSYHRHFHCPSRIVKYEMGDFTFRNLIQAGNLGVTEGAGGFNAPIGFVVFEDHIEGKAERTGLLASNRRTQVAQARHVHLGGTAAKNRSP